MLYSEIIAVCSQIHTKHINTLCGQNVECRTYRAVNTLRLSYKNQPVNAVQWNNRCLFSDPHKNVNTLCGQNVELWILNWRYVQCPVGFTVKNLKVRTCVTPVCCSFRSQGSSPTCSCTCHNSDPFFGEHEEWSLVGCNMAVARNCGMEFHARIHLGVLNFDQGNICFRTWSSNMAVVRTFS